MKNFTIEISISLSLALLSSVIASAIFWNPEMMILEEKVNKNRNIAITNLYEH